MIYLINKAYLICFIYVTVVDLPD